MLLGAVFHARLRQGHQRGFELWKLDTQAKQSAREVHQTVVYGQMCSAAVNMTMTRQGYRLGYHHKAHSFKRWQGVWLYSRVTQADEVHVVKMAKVLRPEP